MLLGKKSRTLQVKCLAGAGVVYKSTTYGITFSSVLHLFSLLCFCCCVFFFFFQSIASSVVKKVDTTRGLALPKQCLLCACQVTECKAIHSVLCLNGHQPLLLSQPLHVAKECLLFQPRIQQVLSRFPVILWEELQPLGSYSQGKGGTLLLHVMASPSAGQRLRDNGRNLC